MAKEPRLLIGNTPPPHRYYRRRHPSVLGTVKQGSIVLQFCYGKQTRFEHVILDLLQGDFPEFCERSAAERHGDEPFRLEVSKATYGYVMIKVPAKLTVVSLRMHMAEHR